MSGINDIRRNNARFLSEQLSSEKSKRISAFASKIDRSYPQTNNWIGSSPVKNIGHSTARHIEKCFDLKDGWLDLVHTDGESGLTQDEQLIMSMYRVLSPIEKQLAYRLLASIRNQ